MMAADLKQITAEAAVLKAEGRLDEAIARYRDGIASAPRSVAAEHNLAVALSEAGLWRDAKAHIDSAFAKGGDAPQTWLMLGRCLQSLGELDASESAFLEALKRQPDYFDAHNDLAQLRWMRTSDVAAALATLEQAMRQFPANPQLPAIKAKVLEHAGRIGEAFALMAAAAQHHPNELGALVMAAQLAHGVGDDDAALVYAEHAARIAPQENVVRIELAMALLALGQPERAAQLASAVRAEAPYNQHAIALQATAWRLLGDARYASLYNYWDFVSSELIDTPPGWASLAAYIGDLSEALHNVHGFNAHPLGQSIRGGTQAPDILQHQDPAIQGLRVALDGPIRRHLAKLGQGEDVMRARNAGAYRFHGIWSIRMSTGGFHTDHVHPDGWISSALYVDVPPQLSGRQGALKLGQPGIRTRPNLEAEHFIEPAPGRLVLFPSYMWHGTVPYAQPATRMSVAFDLVPA